MAAPRGILAIPIAVICALTLILVGLVAPAGARAECGAICDQYTLDIPKKKGGNSGGGGPEAPEPAPEPAPTPAPAAPLTAAPPPATEKEPQQRKRKSRERKDRDPKPKPAAVEQSEPIPSTPLSFEQSSTSEAALGTLDDPGAAALLAGLLLVGLAIALGRRISTRR